MAHTYNRCLLHIVFSTKYRRPSITDEIREPLWHTMAEIARRIRMFPLAIGGVSDHVHLLVSLPTTLSIAQGIKRIKGGSARWVHEMYPLHEDFVWQTGYGSFSVDASRVATVIAYIDNQERHHRKQDYQKELRVILKRYNVEYDERSIWN